ncbi:hypothetical protein FB45DRAFT_786088 [Roridomyces roridus]|uniref:DUF6534 domain-containing protein n=1 Tax=Roridomyces roridus TaxID=1738132 RepID=A0AAD7C950_9AGAR|nr:hypothetical protein FB45DRAFT_786088 [Roridomyces roridus]
MSAPHIPTTLGALLIGGFVATMFSGVVTLQTLWYSRAYKSDPKPLKSLVLSVWLLDTIHTALIWAAVWDCLIGDYGSFSSVDHIPWPIPLTVILTAILTFLIHCFLAHRIFMLSGRNYFMALPVLILAVVRVVSASVTTQQMEQYGSYTEFKAHAFWLFTLGLSVSSAVDILITALLSYLLQSTRPTANRLNAMVNKLTVAAFETGALTCVGTIASMICWVSMPSNLIFLGLHFVISKLYATSLLVTLNIRKNILETDLESESTRPYTSPAGQDNPVIFNLGVIQARNSMLQSSPVQVHMVKSTEYDI